jgi:hypothetical protein
MQYTCLLATAFNSFKYFIPLLVIYKKSTHGGLTNYVCNDKHQSTIETFRRRCPENIYNLKSQVSLTGQYVFRGPSTFYRVQLNSFF